MADEKWQKVREIFDSALRRQPEERQRFVNEACGGDKSVLAEVESLLSSHSNSDSFLETPAVANVADAFEPATQTLEKGKRFGHYEIIRQIGSGGMGEVYLAKDKKLDRQVAVKILNEKFSREESSLQRFISEAKAASSLNHPNILVIYEIGEEDEVHYIVSEFIKGKTLRELLKSESLKLSVVLDIAIQTANALTAAHEARLVHRDIKPENIMIRPDGYVKILDFGLAKLVEQKNKSILGLEDETAKQNETAKGIILGTVNYMSPEQAKGEKVDERTDVFSFGVVIYETLTGRTPFAGNSVSETFANLLNAEPQPIGRFAADVPAKLQRIVSKMLRKDKDERYQTMKDLLTDLKDLREHRKADEKMERFASSESENATAILQATTGDANKQTASTQNNLSGQFKQHKSFAAVALAVLLIGAVGFWFFANLSTNTRRIESIAVLPLENLSGDPAQDYFADGMTEALIGNLSQIGALKVISRTSVMRYKKSGKSIPEIAKELGVDGLIEGSVQRSGDRIRITTQLIHAATDSPIWTKNYERSVSDILKLQSEIAQAVASEIRIQLTPQEQQQFAKTRSIDPRAAEAFLLGRHYFHSWTQQSERQAVEQFQKAVSIEPEYAEAWAGLADAWQVRGIVGDIGFGEAENPARDAAQNALELDPENSPAHISMCFIHNNYDFDWSRSETSCRRGIELDPDNAKGHFAYAYMLARVERWDEMAEQMEIAMHLDPAEPWWPSVYGSFLIQARRFEEAEKNINRSIEINPNWMVGYGTLLNLFIETARFDEAIKLAEKLQYRPLSMAYVYARKGDRQKAMDYLNRGASDQDRFKLALVYSALDDFDKAFAALNKSLDRRDGFNGYGNYLVLDKLKSDPRWKDISRRINLPPKS
ncbi:MAG: protein kinase [Pyrinomonadaceae bacterium]